MELSYSFHVGVDKNKSLRGKQLAKNSKYESKSQTNNAIQNQAQLTKADKHNLRKYENNPEQIEVIVGTNCKSQYKNVGKVENKNVGFM